MNRLTQELLDEPQWVSDEMWDGATCEVREYRPGLVTFDYHCHRCEVRGTSPVPVPACWYCGLPATATATLGGRLP